jgi:hypothetical protein
MYHEIFKWYLLFDASHILQLWDIEMIMHDTFWNKSSRGD